MIFDSATYVDEDCFFDFVVKERVARLIASRSQGISCDFGAPYNTDTAPLFDIDFQGLRHECPACDNYVVDLYSEDTVEFSEDWECKVPLAAFVSLAFGNIIHPTEVRECSDSEITSRIGFYTDVVDADGEQYVLSFVRALEKYFSGNKEEALACREFCEVCRALAELFSPADYELPMEFGADNAGLLLASFCSGEEDHTRVIVTASREVALYEKYRDKLPDDIKALADGYTHLFEAPISGVSDSWLRYKVYGDVAVCLVVNVMDMAFVQGAGDDEFDMACEASMCTRGFNVYYESAVRWIDKNLPRLREEYMVSECGHTH